jgi:hypothetical protein
MSLVSFTSNGREYEVRCQQDFVPPNVSLKELRDVVPQSVFKKSTVKGVYYVVRSITVSFAFFKFATCIDPLAAWLSARTLAFVVRWGLWIIYWSLQGLAWGGLWALGACFKCMYAVFLCLIVHQDTRLGTRCLAC